MIGEMPFNFRGIHIFAAGYIHILEPANDVIVTILILAAQITTA